MFLQLIAIILKSMEYLLLILHTVTYKRFRGEIRMNEIFSIEVSEENAFLLKSILMEERIPYKMRPFEYVQDENGLIKRGLGTISIECEADFMTPYRRVLKSEIAHALRRLEESPNTKTAYDWKNVRTNLGTHKGEIIEKLMADEKTFHEMQNAVREILMSSMESLSKTPPEKKSKKGKGKK